MRPEKFALIVICLLSAVGCKTGDYDYCDVQSIIEEKCVVCHSDPPTHQAPFSLATYDDVKAHAAASKSEIKSRDMPIIDHTLGNQKLTKEERKMLLDWFRKDAPDCAPMP